MLTNGQKCSLRAHERRHSVIPPEFHNPEEGTVHKEGSMVRAACGREKSLGLTARRTQPSVRRHRRPREGMTQGELGCSAGRLLQAEGTAWAKGGRAGNSRLDTRSCGRDERREQREMRVAPFHSELTLPDHCHQVAVLGRPSVAPSKGER